MIIIIIGRIACRISKIRPIVIDRVVWSVCQSVCRSVDLFDRTVSPANAKPAEPIEMHAIRGVDSGGPKEACIRRGVHIGATLRTRLNRVHVRRRCGLMSNYFDHLLVVATLTQQ